MFTADTLRGKTFLITGGGSGLGLAMAQGFAKLGANVAICGRDQAKLDRAVATLRSYGGKVSAVSVDVRDYAGVGKMVEQVVSELGTLDGLVNNAAGNFYSTSEDLSENGFKTVIDIVLQGTFNCTQHVGRYLIDKKRPGVMLSIVTTYAWHGSAFVLPSACAKAGVLALTKSLAYEWAEYGIRLNAIAPGPIPTEGAWARLMPKDLEAKYKNSMPLKRFGTQDELANLACYLMSDMAGFMTGEVVTMDGGENLKAGEFNFLAEMFPRPELKKMFQKIRGK